MQKTKLGISVGLLGAAAYVAVYFGGYVPALLITGYVLLFEENEWLKRTCVKAIALSMLISVLLTVIGLVPDLLRWIDTIAAVFGSNFKYFVVDNIISVFTVAVGIIKTCLFLVLALKALTQSTIVVPVVDKFISKYI